ncbi:hypothetical protein CC86DRAFT_383482 [Ophiobolus disseminans]|uniref:Uncharacterized protein n=1 Tax=Ophiobolus disseminans TaxID=1469910 RepID=A0A6A6ZUD0_9PLEO|nr:hypothetical protein CC86DRAFT_383482 [Ophiobolus disseminans]
MTGFNGHPAELSCMVFNELILDNKLHDVRPYRTVNNLCERITIEFFMTEMRDEFNSWLSIRGQLPTTGPNVICNIMTDIAEKKLPVPGMNNAKLTWQVCKIVNECSSSFSTLAFSPNRSQLNRHRSNDAEAFFVAVRLRHAPLVNAFFSNSVKVLGDTLLFGRTLECLAMNCEFEDFR